MKKTLFLSINLCILILFIIPSSCKQKEAVKPVSTPVLVTVDTAKLSLVTYFDEYPGTVVALNQVNIMPQVTGYITGVHFKDGEHVKIGQLLYSLDQQLYQANVLQANANYKAAESNLLKAKQDADRYLFLQKNNAIAKQVVDHSLAELEAAKMEVAAARAAVQNVLTGLKYTTIYAPMTGTIGISSVKPGASVSPGVTLLNTISSDNPISVDFNLDEKQIDRFNNVSGSTTSTDSTFLIRLPSNNLYYSPGKLILIDRAVDPQTATIKARVELPNPANELKAGMSCTVLVKNRQDLKQILIPYQAVTEQLGEYYVFTISNKKATRKKLSLGRQIDNKVIVLAGLSDGDIVVTEGTAKLKDDTVVSIVSTPK